MNIPNRHFFLPIILLVLASECYMQTIESQTRIVAEGLKAEVIIKKDARSIPYIEAKNDEDLYFAQGFMTARDRLWQMDLYRRVASGRTAELFGKVALEQDKRWKRFGFEAIVQQSYQKFSPEYRKVLDSYTRGVNAFISSLKPDSMPPEFRILQIQPEIWKPTDSLIIGKILSDGLSTSWHLDVTRAKFASLPKEQFEQLFIEKTPFDVLVVGKDNVDSRLPEPVAIEAELIASLSAFADSDLEIRKQSLQIAGFYQEFNAASNNWVISGKRTLDGKPILANDPHLEPSAPGIWYLSNLASPTGKVSGVTFPGVPGIVLGHNEFIAWGATNLGPDVQDLYIEKFNDKDQFLTVKGWQDVKKRTEVIKVRKTIMNPEVESISFEVLETDDGVIIQDQGSEKTALKWTALDSQLNEFEAFYLLNRAKNWTEFKSALKTYGGATQNFIYADVKGNIGFHNGGKIPIRSSGDGSLPNDGSKGDGKWEGYIPFEELPNSYNPPEGYIVTANQRIAGDSYKFFLGRSFADPYRARRIQQLVDANSKMTIKDSMDIQKDIFSISLSNFAREVINMNAASSATLAVLKGWDGKTSPDSKAALIVVEMRRAFLRKVLAGILGEEKANNYRWSMQNSLIDWLAREQPANWLPKTYPDYRALLLDADKTAREVLTNKFGADESKWLYGKNGSFNFNHPLAAAPLIGSVFANQPFDVFGGFSTPNVGSAVSMRLVASPGNWDRTRLGIPLGQSGDPKSVHFRDQFESWRSGNTQEFPFSKTAVESAAKETIMLTPR